MPQVWGSVSCRTPPIHTHSLTETDTLIILRLKCLEKVKLKYFGIKGIQNRFSQMDLEYVLVYRHRGSVVLHEVLVMKYKVWTCHAMMISPSIFSHFPVDSTKVHQFNL